MHVYMKNKMLLLVISTENKDSANCAQKSGGK